MPTVYLGVGSNQNDRRQMIQKAQAMLSEKGIAVQRISPIYETAALLKPDQPETMPHFLNAVFEVETSLKPESLLEVLEDVEKKLGRTKKGNWEPRTIDLDILFYDDVVMKSSRLTIPHPEIHRRWFVLKPLSDLMPERIHPVLKKTVKQLLKELKGENHAILH